MNNIEKQRRLHTNCNLCEKRFHVDSDGVLLIDGNECVVGRYHHKCAKLMPFYERTDGTDYEGYRVRLNRPKSTTSPRDKKKVVRLRREYFTSKDGTLVHVKGLRRSKRQKHKKFRAKSR